MRQMQSRNPQEFQKVNQAINNGVDPRQFAKQVFKGMDNNQMSNILNQAKSMGCPDNVLREFQNMNN